MQINTNRATALLLAALMVGTALTVGVGALTTDTETTTTTVSSDVTDTTVLTEPHNGSVVQNVAVNGDSNTNTSSLTNPETAMTLAVVVNDSSSDQNGETLYTDDSNFSVSAVSGAPDDYNRTLANDVWGDELEYGAGENVTLDYRVTFNESESDESVHNITVTVDPAAGESEAWVQFDDDETEAEGNASIAGISVASIPGFSSSVGAAQATDTVNVTENTSTVVLATGNQSATDAFAEVTDATSSGELTTDAYVAVGSDDNETYIPVFVESADAEWVDTDTDTYAVVAESGDRVVIYNANETLDSGSVEITATGNEALGFTNTVGMLRNYGAGPGTTFTTAAGAVNADGNPFNNDEG